MHSFTPKNGSRKLSDPGDESSHDDAVIPGAAKFDAIIGDMTPAELQEFADYIAGKLESSTTTANEGATNADADIAVDDTIPADDAEPDTDTDPLEDLEVEDEEASDEHMG